jgi:hypothetical protein
MQVEVAAEYFLAVEALQPQAHLEIVVLAVLQMAVAAQVLAMLAVVAVDGALLEVVHLLVHQLVLAVLVEEQFF